MFCIYRKGVYDFSGFRQLEGFQDFTLIHSQLYLFCFSLNHTMNLGKHSRYSREFPEKLTSIKHEINDFEFMVLIISCAVVRHSSEVSHALHAP